MEKYKTTKEDRVPAEDWKLSFKHGGQKGPYQRGDLLKEMWIGQGGKLCGYLGKSNPNTGKSRNEGPGWYTQGTPKKSVWAEQSELRKNKKKQ